MNRLDDIVIAIAERTEAYEKNNDTSVLRTSDLNKYFLPEAKRQIKALFVELVNEASISSGDLPVNDCDEYGTPIIYVYKLLQKVNDL